MANDYEWYPGHMTAAIRMMREELKLIDLVIEAADARIPAASRNPDIDSLCQGKARLLILNKADLSDQAALSAWMAHYRKKALAVVCVNAKAADAKKAVFAAVNEAAEERRERNARRGLKNQPIRALVAGIPNVGKSTIINLLAGRNAAKTGNKPGVTRGKQWIQTGRMLQLLDSPGILWPRIGDRNAGELLALVGSMNDGKLDEEALAAALIARLSARYPQAIGRRYFPEAEGKGAWDEERMKLSFMEEDGASAPEILAAIAQTRGCVGEGGRMLTGRAARILLDDFRAGRLGGMLLESPEAEGSGTRT